MTFHEFIYKKSVYFWGDLTGFLLAVFGSFAIYFLRNFFKRLILVFGVTYFDDIQIKYGFIGTWLIRSMERLNSDRVALYRTYDGKSYIESKGNKRIKIRSIINKVANEGIKELPDKLEHLTEYKSIFEHMLLYPSFTEFITSDLLDRDIETSRTKSNLLNFGIHSYMFMKIRDDNGNLYGFVIYTWSEVKQMPKNLNAVFANLHEDAYRELEKAEMLPEHKSFRKNREYMINLRNSISIRYIEIVNMLISEKIRCLYEKFLFVFSFRYFTDRKKDK